MYRGFIYLITCMITGKMYVGQTRVSIKRRWDKHCLKSNSLLYRSIEKYGKENFYVDQIEKIETNTLSECCTKLNNSEVYWIDKLKTFSPNGFNLTTGGKMTKISNETKLKIGLKSKGNKFRLGQSPWNKGKKSSEETKKKLSDINKGKKHSKETIAKRSASLKGRKYSQESIQKRINTRRLNGSYVFSEEHKRKISEAAKGKKRGPLSEEHKRKIGISNKGLRKGCTHSVSEETKQKIGTSHKINKNHSGKYKGLTKLKDKFQVIICINNKRKYIGVFSDEIEAAKTYDRAVLEFYPKGSYLNFPNEIHEDSSI